MAGQFDRIVEELYNKVALGKGYCDEVLSEEGLEYFKKLIEFYEKPEIIETYQSGSSWYRVYRDGWCEQGGTVNSDPTSTFTVAFLRDYSDTNYTVSLTHLKNDTAVQFRWAEVYVKSKSGFTFVTPYGQTGATGLGQVMWVTYGFISTEN